MEVVKPIDERQEEKSESVKGHVEAPEQVNLDPTSTAKVPTKRRAIGSISSLDALLANAQKVDNERKEMNTPWELDFINKIWVEHAGLVEANSTKNALLSAKIALKGEKEVIVVTPNKINTETIKKEMDLIEKIRNSYPDRILVFTIYDDLSEFPELTKVEKVKKAKTNQEKLDLLVEKNPKVAEFIERFNLKVDK